MNQQDAIWFETRVRRLEEFSEDGDLAAQRKAKMQLKSLLGNLATQNQNLERSIQSRRADDPDLDNLRARAAQVRGYIRRLEALSIQ